MSRFAVRAALCGIVVAMVGAGVGTEGAWVRGSVGVIVYSIYVPTSYSASQKYPVVMLLHGAGASGTNYANAAEQDAMILASETNQVKYPCIVYAPEAPTYTLHNHWVNFPGDDAGGSYWQYGSYSITTITQSTAMRDALKGLDTVCAKYSIDTNRIYLAGGSMGGYGTWDCLSRGLSPRFACAVPTSGGGDTSKAATFKNLPIWAFHCNGDGIISVNISQQMVDAVKKAGGSPKFTKYDESQLGVNGYVHYGAHMYILPFQVEPLLMPWIFAQSKGTSPVAHILPAHATQNPVNVSLHDRSILIRGSQPFSADVFSASGQLLSHRVVSTGMDATIDLARGYVGVAQVRVSVGSQRTTQSVLVAD